MRGKPTAADREQIARFARYLRRRADKPYAEIYGDVVYESKEADMGCTHEATSAALAKASP